jgi:hypothetical protein
MHQLSRSSYSISNLLQIHDQKFLSLDNKNSYDFLDDQVSSLSLLAIFWNKCN